MRKDEKQVEKQKQNKEVCIKEQKVKTEKGITILALVITIIVLLILAGITISAITSDNGIIQNAGKAKEETEIANEKEILEKATVQAMGNNKYGNIEKDELQSALDKETGEGKTKATDIGEEFEIAFIDTKRYYTIDKEGKIIEVGEIVEDKSPGDITKDENGNTLKGDENEPYEIWCIEDLIEWSKNYEICQNANIILCKNLDFKSKYSYANSENINYGDINQDGKVEYLINELDSGIGFTPITSFSGTFDGQNYSIENIYEKNTSELGVWGRIKNGTISNLKVNGMISSYNNDEKSGNVGGIVGSVINRKNKKLCG